MKKTNFYLLNVVFLLLFNCKMLYSQDTIIVGKAQNAKYGAIVVSSNSDVYYIDKLAFWSSVMYAKNVKVSGRLVVKKIKKKINTTSGGITGPEIKIIKKPKIQILSDSQVV